MVSLVLLLSPIYAFNEIAYFGVLPALVLGLSVLLLNGLGLHTISRPLLSVSLTLTLVFFCTLLLPGGSRMPVGTPVLAISLGLLSTIIFDVREKFWIFSAYIVNTLLLIFLTTFFGLIEINADGAFVYQPWFGYVLVCSGSSIAFFILFMVQIGNESSLSTLQKYNKEILEWNQSLENRVYERTKELLASEEELRQNLEEIQSIQEAMEGQSQKIHSQNESLLASEEELKQNLEELKSTQEHIEKQNQILLKLQQEEQEANEVFRVMFEESSNAHLLFDKDRGIFDCNSAAVKLLGYTHKSQCLGLRPPQLSPEYQPNGIRSSEAIKEHAAQLQEGRFVRFEWVHLRADGSEFWVDVSLTPLVIKNMPTILAVWNDLSYIKEKEIALEKSNKELSETLKNLQETQNQLIMSDKMATLGQLVANIAHEINTPLGAIRSSSNNISSASNKVIKTLPKFFQQLSEQEMMVFEDMLVLTSDKNERLSTRELRTLRYELIDQLEALKVVEAEQKAEILLSLGLEEHINQFTELLCAPHALSFLKNMQQMSLLISANKNVLLATDKAAKIVFALKNFSRQDHTGFKQPIRLNASLETTLSLYHHQIKQHVEVVREFSEIPEFDGYPDELVQVWTNLVHNALQAISGKGKITINTSLRNNLACVSIQDTGVGIPKAIQPKIFDPFFTTKKAGEGSGLGLDIVRKIVEKHEGRIYFESTENVGTTFFVEIPILSAKETQTDTVEKIID